jgi:hypothetical protein
MAMASSSRTGKSPPATRQRYPFIVYSTCGSIDGMIAPAIPIPIRTAFNDLTLSTSTREALDKSRTP